MKLYEALRTAAKEYRISELYQISGMCLALRFSKYGSYLVCMTFFEDVVKPFIYQYSRQPIEINSYWWPIKGSPEFDPQIRVDCLNTLADYAEYLDV